MVLRIMTPACLLLALTLTGCAEKPAAAPAPSRGAGLPDASLPPGHPAVDAAPPMAMASVDPQQALSGTITAGALAKDMQAAALFIIVRNQATRSVLAVRREEPKPLPREFSISGADAMVPGTEFKGPFELTVRLSKTGDAIPAAGDVEGTLKDVAAGSGRLNVTLDTIRK